MTPLTILLERADAALLAYGADAQEVLLHQIEAAIRGGEGLEKVRDLDHVLQLVDYRERAASAKSDGAARDGLRGPTPSLSGPEPASHDG